MASFSPTHPETALVNAIFAKNDPQKFGVITGEVAVNIFGGSKLPPTVLGEIWAIADDENNGFLTRKGVGVALRLIGWAQNGEAVSRDLINMPGPLAVIEGYSSSAPRNVPSPSPKSPPPAALPQLTPQDKAKFTRLFNGCGPVNGLLSGEKARDVFVKSKLPVEKLSQIWNLADTQSRGSLDVADFIVAMYLIQACMSGQLTFVPTTLPPGLYEQASGKLDGVAANITGGSGTLSPSVTGSFPSRPSGVIQPQYTGQGTLQPQYTGSGIRPTPTIPPRPQATLPPFPIPAQATGQAQHWDVTASEKASSDQFFETLDTTKRGYIEGDVAVPFMLQSKLPEDVLAQVWDLADLNNDGRLTRDGFAVAMHLIQGKLSGKDVPSTLPPSLIPPSMRTSALVASPFHTQIQQQEPARDLLWDETPPPSATTSQQQSHLQSQILQPQQTGSRTLDSSPFAAPPSFPSQATPGRPPVQDPFATSASNDLLGDDEDTGATSPVNLDHSAEIGNVQNQLSSTNRSLETTKAERTSVENNIAQQAAQLTALQTQLSSAKAAYETETRLLSALRERFNSQSSDIQKAREELIRAESDLSAVRVEKAELEQSLLRDKEEVRDLQRKMTETGTTIEQLKVEIEKAKKTAKHQKGLLAIAKKQLATREAEKSKVEKELQEAQVEAQQATKEREDAEAELTKDISSVLANGDGAQPAPEQPTDSVAFAAAHPLPGTPGSPSSVLSGATAKSNNPFDRLVASNTGSSSRSQSPFLPFANATLPTPAGTVSDAPSAGPVPGADNTTDDPFGFSQPFEASSTAPAAPETSADIDHEISVPTPRPASLEPTITATEEIASPTSDKDLFSTPPSTAVPLPSSPSPARASPQPAVEAAIAHFPPVEAATTSASAPVHHEETDLSSQLKELEVEESDSSNDEEDSKPLATLIGKAHDTVATSAEAPAANGADAASKPGFSFDDAFAAPAQPAAPAAAPPVATNTTGTSPFPPPPAAATTFDSVFEAPPAKAGISDFDEALGKIPGSAGPAADSSFTFDSAFDDNFDFAAAGGATTFPPAPVATNGAAASALPSAAPKSDGFDSLFAPASNGTAPQAAAPQPSGATESKPFNFEDAFGGGPATAPPPSAPQPAATESLGISFDDAFGGETASKALAFDNAFGSTSSRGSGAPQPRSPTGPTPFPASSPQQPTSPRRASHISSSPPPRESTPPPRISSPKLRPSTGSSRDSHEKPHEKVKDQPRHSKLSIRLPFGKKKKTQDAPVPPSSLSHHLTPVVDETVGSNTPAVEDDAEPVKQLCGMGFSRTQAVTALETNGYDFQRALNSLLGS